MIEARTVSKRYGEAAVVDNVSFTWPAGGLTAIIGPNGAGKSSLLSMLGRLASISEGSASIDGLDVTKTPSTLMSQRLAILKQDNHLTLRLSVRDLVAFGRYPYSKGRLTAHDRLHVAQSLSYLNLESIADRFLDELSGGQRQRAFVAMVLCQDTEYVLLDEPLNSLDIRHAVEMMRLLRRMVNELGKTVVVVLHDINFASCYADHIMAMKDGKVVCQGTPFEVVSTEKLQAIYGINVRVQEIDGQRIAVYFS